MASRSPSTHPDTRPAAPASSRPFYLRGWIPVAAAIAVALAILPWILRSSGAHALAEVQAEIRAAGGAASLEEYLERIDIDESLVDAWRAWEQQIYAMNSAFPALHLFEDDVWRWLADPHAPVPAGIRDFLEREDPIFRPAFDLVAEPGFVLTEAAFVKRDYREGSPIDWRNVDVSFLAVRALADWMMLHAAFEDDPTPWLDALDALVACLRPEFVPMLSSLAHDRDLAYLWAAIRGRVDESRLRAWAASSAPYRECIRVSIEFDRCVRWNWMLTEPYRTDEPIFWPGVRKLRAFQHWMGFPGDVARGARALWELEQEWSRNEPDSKRLYASSFPSFWTETAEATFWTGNWKDFSSIEAEERARRIGTLLVFELLHEGRALPATRGELDRRWPELAAKGAGERETLVYQRYSETAFSIVPAQSAQHMADYFTITPEAIDFRSGFGISLPECWAP